MRNLAALPIDSSSLLNSTLRSVNFELLQPEAEPACPRFCDGFTLKPDSYVELGAGEFMDIYFLEVDRGQPSPGPRVRRWSASPRTSTRTPSGLLLHGKELEWQRKSHP
jgi:hypothetical protein